MLKKLTLLAMAVAALVAFAAPAAAQAEADWTHEGTVITEDHHVEFTGPAEFNLAESETGAHAIVHAEITLYPDTGTGTVSAFHVTNCTGTGELNGFPCTGSPTFPDWPVQARADGTILITIPKTEPLHNVYYADAGHTFPVATTALSGPVIATPDNSGEIGSVQLVGGEGLEANGNAAEASGELAVTEGDAGTYGIKAT